MGPIPPAPPPRYILQVRPGPDLCTPLPSTRHTEVVYRDRGRERYISATLQHGPMQPTGQSCPPINCPPTSPTGQSCPSSCCLFSLPARSPKRPVPRHLPPLRIPLAPAPSHQGPPPANWRPSPSAHRAALPRPIAPVAQGGPRHHRRRPTPRGQWAGACIRWVVTWAPVGTEGLDRPPGSPCQCPTHPSNAPHPHHRPASIWARTVGPGSPLHRLTDHIWVIKRHATLSGARKCWWGTYLYGGGPCTAFLHTK